jgi:hypothetical protein
VVGTGCCCALGSPAAMIAGGAVLDRTPLDALEARLPEGAAE